MPISCGFQAGSRVQNRMRSRRHAAHPPPIGKRYCDASETERGADDPEKRAVSGKKISRFRCALEWGTRPQNPRSHGEKNSGFRSSFRVCATAAGFKSENVFGFDRRPLKSVSIVGFVSTREWAKSMHKVVKRRRDSGIVPPCQKFETPRGRPVDGGQIYRLQGARFFWKYFFPGSDRRLLKSVSAVGFGFRSPVKITLE